MEIRYIILFICILILYVLLNTVEGFSLKMIGTDKNGALINISGNCANRIKDQCETTHGCFWNIYTKAGKEIKECQLKQNLTSGYGKGGVNLHVPSACHLRNSQNCEATHGCSWGSNQKKCMIAPGWLEEKDIDGKVVHFHKKCSKRILNYCMIGPDCFLDGGSCQQKPDQDKFERESCRIDRRNLVIGDKVNMCRNVRIDWTPEHDKKDDIFVPIPTIEQTKTCWHCPKPL